jgi:hypothetical protein
VFVNADEIAKQRWPDDAAAHAYEAALIAADTRERLIELGRCFIAETVFSHPSKLELIDTARGSHYTVGLHVLLIPEELAVRRGIPCAGGWASVGGEQDSRALPPAVGARRRSDRAERPSRRL